MASQYSWAGACAVQALLPIKLSYDKPSIVRRVTIEPFIEFEVPWEEKNKKGTKPARTNGVFLKQTGNHSSFLIVACLRYHVRDPTPAICQAWWGKWAPLRAKRRMATNCHTHCPITCHSRSNSHRGNFVIPIVLFQRTIQWDTYNTGKKKKKKKEKRKKILQ